VAIFPVRPFQLESQKKRVEHIWLSLKEPGNFRGVKPRPIAESELRTIGWNAIVFMCPKNPGSRCGDAMSFIEKPVKMGKTKVERVIICPRSIFNPMETTEMESRVMAAFNPNGPDLTMRPNLGA